jgi:hypothetical protein
MTSSGAENRETRDARTGGHQGLRGPVRGRPFQQAVLGDAKCDAAMPTARETAVSAGEKWVSCLGFLDVVVGLDAGLGLGVTARGGLVAVDRTDERREVPPILADATEDLGDPLVEVGADTRARP